jgi:iron complex outermembrane receptor protein
VFLLHYDYDGDLAANGVPPLPAATSPNRMTMPPGWYPDERGDALTDSNPPLAGLSTLVPEAETSTVLLEGDFALTDDVTLYSEELLSRRKTTRIGLRQIWSYIYNDDSADLGYPSNPLSVGWTGAQWLSPLAIVDGANSVVEVDYQRFLAGLRGDNVGILDGWHWDAAFQYSKSNGEYVNNVTLNDSIQTSYWQTGSCAGALRALPQRREERTFRA